MICDNNVKKCLKCPDVSRHLDASFSPHFQISVCLFFFYVRTECIRTRFNQMDFKVYQSIQELLLKAVAGEDHDKELAKVMTVYRDLQQYKLEAQLSLLPEVVQAMGYDTS